MQIYSKTMKNFGFFSSCFLRFYRITALMTRLLCQSQEEEFHMYIVFMRFLEGRLNYEQNFVTGFLKNIILVVKRNFS